MELRCSLCGKSVEELAKEELERSSYNRKAINISLDDKLGYPYLLCGGCDDFLRTAIPSLLEDLGILSFDEAQGKYILVH